MRGLGCHPDPIDTRDSRFSAHRFAATPPPAFASCDWLTVPPKDQGSTSSCVGMGVTGGLRMAILKTGVDCPELSAMFVYRGARNSDGTDGDEGTFIRSGLKVLKELGAADESAWKFDEHLINAQPGMEAIGSAYDRKGLKSYHRVTTVQEVQQSIAAGAPVVAGWQVSEKFVESNGREVFDTQTAPIAGGHCMAVVAYGSPARLRAQFGDPIPPTDEPVLFRLLNSWGSDYGYNGRIYVTAGMVRQMTDGWSLDVREAT